MFKIRYDGAKSWKQADQRFEANLCYSVSTNRRPVSKAPRKVVFSIQAAVGDEGATEMAQVKASAPRVTT